MTGVSPRRRVFAWMMFDWASQPFYTLCLTFIFGPYMAAVATSAFMAQGQPEAMADANAQSLWSLVQTLTGLAIAFTAPILGAMADNSGRPMRWVVGFSVLYVAGVWGLWGLMPDGTGLTLALICFAVAMIGVEYATIFTNAMLPGLGDKKTIGKISGSGFALGYAGGVVSLFLMLLFLAEGETGRTLLGLSPAFGLDPELREGTRAVGPFSAIWYLVFMVPFFLWLRVGPRVRRPGGVRRALADTVVALRGVVKHRSLAVFLGSSMLYRDSLVALYGFGGVYATLVLDWPVTSVGVFGIIGALSAMVASWIGGHADYRFGPKPVIVVMVLCLAAVCVVIAAMSREAIFGLPLAPGSKVPDITFFVLGALIGAGGGVLQACSRSLMVRHADPDRPTEAFGLYALSGKATAFLAPGLIGTVTYLSGSARIGITPLIGLFLLALVLLLWVHPEGRSSGLMMRYLILGLALALSACGGGKVASNQPTVATQNLVTRSGTAKALFGAESVASPQSPDPYGSYAKGCLAGGVQLPETGPTWQAMRLSRNRNWAHPATVALVKRVSQKAAGIPGYNGIYVGDMSQPRGGPMLTGHASHQIGLDADIWLMPAKLGLSETERENLSAKSYRRSNGAYTSSDWGAAQMALIKAAATEPEVARIFLFPGAKVWMCQNATGNRDWLRKVRPWWGHHYHFHVRLACPKGARGCVNQDPPPPGDGCAEAQTWVNNILNPPPPKPRDPNAPPPKPKRELTMSDLPAQCNAVLSPL